MYTQEFEAMITRTILRARFSNDPRIRAYPDLIQAQRNRVDAAHNELLRLIKQATEDAPSLESIKESLNSLKEAHNGATQA